LSNWLTGILPHNAARLPNKHKQPANSAPDLGKAAHSPGIFITIKNPRIAAGICWKLSLPTQLNPTNQVLARRLCGNEQSGQPVFISDNNANGGSKS
jgi:hypothetical protein